MKRKLTVCIPCYNAEKHIKETIKSVLAQTYREFNLFIIDNNSTDKTLSLISKIKDKRIAIFKNKKNIGMFGNMNKCIQMTKTPYLKILCADDILFPECLEKQVEVLEKNDKVHLVYNANRIINDHEKILTTRRYFPSSRKVNGGALINSILKSGRNPVGEPSNVMLRTSILKRNKLVFDESLKYISDLELWIQILLHGDGYYINEVLNAFRIHTNSGTYSLYVNAIKEHSKLVSLYGEYIDLSIADIIVINMKLYLNLLIKSILLRFI
ncbi:MAG: glycosyltransferase [Oligoflexia bacterium]|nr:glycosyltransferase [Oligoflexia bacterium]